MADKTFTQDELNEIVKNRVADVNKTKNAEIETLKGAHKADIEAKDSEISTLNNQVKDYEDSEKTIKKLQKEKETVESKLNEYVEKEQTAEWHTKLKENGVKEDRYDAFTKLFGDEERNDENLAKFAEQYPEWVDKGTDKPDTIPRVGQTLDNTTGNQEVIDPFIQALNS
ncbi:hypothetical protein [Listeria booriae]|nr:hypothetical protein [Listeria booriae]